MKKINAVFDEYIFENTISDFSEYLQSHLALNNLNEDEINSPELLYDIKGDYIKVTVSFNDEKDFGEMFQHPVNRMKVNVEISDISLTGFKLKILELFKTFQFEMNNTLEVK